MQIVDEALNRRGFLKLGAAGLAIAGLLSRAVAEEAGTRSAPAHPLTLRSASVELVLDAEDGVPFEYRLRKSGVRFAGEGLGEALRATVHCKEPFGFATVVVKPKGSKVSANALDFQFTAMYASNAPAADFTLRYALTGATVRLTLEDVKEREGFEFISLTMPSIVTVHEREED